MIIVSAQVLWVLTLGLWTLDLGLTIVSHYAGSGPKQLARLGHAELGLIPEWTQHLEAAFVCEECGRDGSAGPGSGNTGNC